MNTIAGFVCLVLFAVVSYVEPRPKKMATCPKGSSPVRPRQTCSLKATSSCGKLGFCHRRKGAMRGLCCRRRVAFVTARCPPIKKAFLCKTRIDRCSSNKDCRRSDMCCPGKCRRVCMPRPATMTFNWPRP